MNSIYKVIFNKSTGQWSAVSELARGNTKSSRSLKMGKVAAALASIIIGSTLSGNAWAQGCPNGAGNDGGPKCTISQDTSWLIDNNKNLTGMVEMSGSGVGTLEFKNSTITHNTSADGSGNGQGIMIMTGGAIINLSGENTINLGAKADTAILALVSGAAGATIDIIGTLNIKNKSTSNSYDRDGVEITNSGGGNSNLSFNGKGTIEVVNGNALFVNNTGTTNSTDIKVASSGGTINLITTGNGASGIYVSNGTRNTGNITIESDAIIKTSGTDVVTIGIGNTLYANGIAALIKNTASTGNISVTNSGTIETAGIQASGILAQTVGAGNIAVVNNLGGILTGGEDAHGISASTTGEGAINVTNKGAIETAGTQAVGVFASTVGAGKVTINNTLNATQSIKTSGLDGASVIHVRSLNGGNNSNGIGINQTGGKFETLGADGNGIQVLTNASLGGIDIDVTDTIMDLKGDNSDGIHVQNIGKGISDLDINITTNGGSITLVDPTITDNSDSNYGIVAYQDGTAKGDIKITNNGTVITTRLAKVADQSSKSHAIEAKFLEATATGNIYIENSGILSTESKTSSGIRAENAGTGNIDITNSGAINTLGATSHGIYTMSNNAGSAGTTKIDSSGAITTISDGANAIYADQSSQGLLTITNTAALTTSGKSAHGISASLGAGSSSTIINSGDITINEAYGSMGIHVLGGSGNNSSIINNSGNIKHSVTTMGLYGIHANLHGDNATSVINHSGTILGSFYGILASDSTFVGQQNSSSVINIKAGATVDAIYAIASDLGGTNMVNIEESALVNGVVIALQFRGDTGETMVNSVTNAGVITTGSDAILFADKDDAGKMDLTFTNTATGKMTGIMSAVKADKVTINNQGVWDVKDRMNVAARVRLSTDVGNSITNSGTMNFLDEITEFTGVPNFTLEGGTLDLTKHAGAGTTVAIGLDNSSSIFTANGGTVRLDTLLDDASSNNGIGTSDRLLLRNTVLGTGATQLFINSIAGGNQGVTINNGIEVVNVAGNSTAGVFALGHDVLSGAYQYQLTQAGNNWYLTNTTGTTPPITPPVTPPVVVPPTLPGPWIPGDGGVIPNPSWPQEPVDPNNPWGAWLPSNPGGGMIGGGGIGNLGQIIYRADAGIELGNRESVIGMMVPGFAGSGSAPNGIAGSGAMRASTRLGGSGAMGTASTDGSYQGQKSNSLWSFATASNSRGKAAGGQIRYSGESYGLQVGGDHIFAVGDGLIQAGIMANMSQTKTRSRNLITGALARGESDGYGLGLYGTWFMRSDTILSPYIDAYAVFGRYKNTVKTRNNSDYSYRSSAFSFTLQGGYPIALTSDILIEPQAQLTYVKYGSKSHQDHGSTTINMNTKGNMIGRVGAYVYGHGYKVQPYGALNVWYDDTQSEMRYNANGGKIGADKRGAIVEAKLGFQTQATSNLTLWGEVSGRKGQNSYRDFGGAIGIKYTW